MAFNPNAQAEAGQEAVKKMQPIVKSTGKRVFSAASVKIGKRMNLSKHDICKNIERKHGAQEANRIAKTL